MVPKQILYLLVFYCSSVYGCVKYVHYYLILKCVCLFYLSENTDKTTICELELDPTKAKQFKDAIENSYWFEFFIGMSYSHESHELLSIMIPV